jgi:hypothetical protein
MTYKPPVAKGNFGTNGQVKIVEVADDKVKFMFREQDKDGNFGETLKLKVKVEDCHPVALVGTWACNLSSNKDRLYNVRPIQGVFPAHFKEFRAPKDEQPSPKMSSGKPEFQHLVFRPLFELTRDDVKGMLVEYQWGLDYNFTLFPDVADGKIAGYSKSLDKSTHTQKLNEFMEACGIWDRGAMKWQENLLPTMQKRALDANKQVLIHVEKGSIKALIPDQSSDFGDREFEDIKQPSKEVVDETQSDLAGDRPEE